MVEAIWWQDRDTATGDGSGDAGRIAGGGKGRAWYFGFISSFMSGTRGTAGDRKVMGGWWHVELQPLARYRRIRI